MDINAAEYSFSLAGTDIDLVVCTDGSFGLWKDNPASVIGRSSVAAFAHKGLRLQVVPQPGPGQGWAQTAPNTDDTIFESGDGWKLRVWGDGSNSLLSPTGAYHGLLGSGARFKVVTEQYRPRPEPKPTTTPPIIVPIEFKLPDDEVEKIDNAAVALGNLSDEIQRYTSELHDAADAAERLESAAQRAEVRRALDDILDGAGVIAFEYELDEAGGLETARVRFNASRKVYVRQGEHGQTLYGVTELEIVE